MTRHPLAVLSVVLLMLTAGCLGAATPAPAETTADGDAATPTVRVSASGSVSVEPDLAVVHLAAEATAESADAARAQVATDVDAVRAAMADLGLPDDAVTTASFHIQPEYDYSRETRELVGYRAVHALSVEADVDQVGQVIDAAVEAGAVGVSGVQFTLTDEARQSAREQALAAAMANAAADAVAVADAGDLTLDGVRSVATGGPVFVPFDGRTAVAEDAASGTTIESGPVTVSASVTVSYSIQ